MRNIIRQSSKTIFIPLFFFIIPFITHSAFVPFSTKIDTIQERINIQVVLNRVMVPSPNLKIDGILGKKSIQAIQAFQESRGLVSDGKVGPITRGALENAQTGTSGTSSYTSTNTTTTTYTTGCSSGALYNTQTGQPCTTSQSYSSGCEGNNKYNTLTGALCDTTTPINNCTDSSTQFCSINNGIGIKFRTCTNNNWSSFSSCAVSSCNSGYQIVGNSCVLTTCSGNSSQACTITNGTGTQSRTCSNNYWSSWGSCTVSSCNSGYQLSGNSCVEISDTILPSITSFLINEASSSLQVPILSFTASDNKGVTGYLISESLTTPNASSGSWASSAPSIYTFINEGIKNLYAWAKDGAGNVSASVNRQTNINLSETNENWQSGIISWWKMDGNASDNIGTNEGTLNGGPTLLSSTNCVSGQCYLFDGSNDSITTNNIITDPQDFTIAGWFKTNTASGRKIIGYENTSTGSSATSWDRQVWIGTNGQLYFGTYNNNTSTGATIHTNTTITDNNWHHFVAVRNDSLDQIYLYLDGILVASTASSSAEHYNGYWRIGSFRTAYWTNGSDGYFPGTLDEVIVWNRHISSSEITTLYTSFGVQTTTTCIGLSSQSCSIANGQGYQSRTCSNGSWSSWGTCTVSSCNSGYVQSGNSCVSSNSSGGCSSSSCTAWEINELLGKGVNAWGVVADGSNVVASNWNDNYFQLIKNAGFDHVRLVIPGLREDGVSQYHISDSTLSNLKKIVDDTISAGLIAVVDYHSPAFLNSPTEDNQNRFVSHWSQVSQYFSSYSNRNLVFELVNEPSGQLSASSWNTLSSRAVSAIRGYDNDRVIIVSPATWASVPGLENFVLPNDDNLIVSIHYYQPHTFTHQCAAWVEGYNEVCGEEWYPIQPFIDEVEEYFEPAIKFSQTNNVPIIIGEFGVYSVVPTESRARYINYHARYFESLGWSWAVWDFFVNGSFEIYKKSTESFIPEVLDALIDNPMPQVLPHSESVIYSSNFNSGTDGWYITTAGTGTANLGISGGELVATVSNPGTEPQSIVLHRAMPMEKGKMYKVTYTIRSSSTRSWMVSRIGKMYTWLNLFNVTPQGNSYDYSFYYSWDSQPSAELWFQIGGSSATFYVSNVSFKELTLR